MIGMGMRANRKSVKMLMTELKSPMLAKTCGVKHFAVAATSKFHAAATGMQEKMSVPAQARAKQMRKTTRRQPKTRLQRTGH